MSKKSQIQEIIDAYIHRNGNKEITGNILNSVLNAMLRAAVIDIKENGQIIPKDEDGNVNLPQIVTPAYVDAKVAEETQRAEGAEGILRSSIAEETRRAKAKETELQNNINAEAQLARGYENQLYTKTSQEEDRAKSAEAQLGNKIDGEISRAKSAESNLSNELSSEKQRAQDAEFDLSARIDAIVQGKDVRDIVADYDELLAYDTSTLGDNDIIMVLLDSTKSGHTTYYRWHIDTQSWEFIGGLAFTYTKTEIDEKFAALHIVLPAINEQSSQETLAQVDTIVRSAGIDASFKMPVSVTDSVVGDVNVTFVKRNPTNLFLGIFADESSTLYTIHRTMGTPKTYDVQIVKKVFATEDYVNSRHVVLNLPSFSEPTQEEMRIIYEKVQNAEDGSVIVFTEQPWGDTTEEYQVTEWSKESGMVIISFQAFDYEHKIRIQKAGDVYTQSVTSTRYVTYTELDEKQDKERMQSVITYSPSNYPSSRAVVDFVTGITNPLGSRIDVLESIASNFSIVDGELCQIVNEE